MSKWVDYLRNILPASMTEDMPGTIRIAFVNRYLEPLDGISYHINVDSESPVGRDIYGLPIDGKVIIGETTTSINYVDVVPQTLDPILVHVWSRRADALKKIDIITPIMNKPQLIHEHMKTFKISSKTMPHPEAAAGQATSFPAPKKIHTPPPAGPSPATNQGVHGEHTNNARGEPMLEVSRPVPDKITVAQLKKIFAGAKEDYLQQVADELNTDLKMYKLDTVLRRAHFFAQVREEAGPALSAHEESLNYKPKVLIQKFSYYKNAPREAEEDGRIEEIVITEKIARKVKKKILNKKVTKRADQETIANKAYAARQGNGDVNSGDGWRYRGRGFIQVTGRIEYSLLNSEYKKYYADEKTDFITNSELVGTFPYTIRSAICYWNKNKLSEMADKGSAGDDVDRITAVVNKNTDTYEQRREHFQFTYATFK